MATRSGDRGVTLAAAAPSRSTAKANAIRDWERNGGRRYVSVIALTAGALAIERERCAAVGMNGFLAKPVTLGELHDALAPHASGQAEPGEAALA